MARGDRMFAAMKGVGKRMLPFAVAALVGCTLSLVWRSLELLEGASRGALERELALEAQFVRASLDDEAETLGSRVDVLAKLPEIRRLAAERGSASREDDPHGASSADALLCDSVEAHQLPGEDLDFWLLDDRWRILAYFGPALNRGRQAIREALQADNSLSPAGHSSTFWVTVDEATAASSRPQVLRPRAHLYAVAKVLGGRESIATLVLHKAVSPLATAGLDSSYRGRGSEVTLVDRATASRMVSGGSTRLPSGELVGRSDDGGQLTYWRYDPAHGIGVIARSAASWRLSQWREVRDKILGLGVVALLLGVTFPLTVRHYRRRLLHLVNRMDAIAASRTLSQKAEFERSLSNLEKQLRDVRQSEARLQAAHLVLEENTEKFARLSRVDPLTDLANRRQFDEFLENEWRRGVRRCSSISLLLIDVDYFKVFVESYGHTAGDDCLREVARALASAGRRPGDLVARLGGEEFAIVLSDTDVEGACAVAHHVRSAVEALAIDHETTLVRGTEIVTLSVGIATEPVTHLNGPAVLLYHADEALYLAKQDGRNCVRTYAENAIRIESSTGIRIPTNRPFAMERRGNKGGA